MVLIGLFKGSTGDQQGQAFFSQTPEGRADERTNGRADARTSPRTSGRADGRTGGRTDGRMVTRSRLSYYAIISQTNFRKTYQNNTRYGD